MRTFAKVGETVVYTGDISYAFDDTASLMNRFFIPKKMYTVKEVGVRIEGGDYYKFKGFAYSYPCRSFAKNSRELVKMLYNLK